MSTKKLAKLIQKVYLKISEWDSDSGATITVEHEGLVKVVENKDSVYTNTVYFNVVDDDIIIYSENSYSDDKPSDKTAISAKEFKKLVKAVCSVRTL